PGTTKVVRAESFRSAFVLHFLEKGHPKSKSVRQTFVTRWKHESRSQSLSVVDVIKIVVPHEVRERHEEYKKTVSNVCQRFHGTSCSGACYFHVGGPICLRPECAACNICM
ncbi:unnamed protein product, partial [Ectocarpus fasciculatus]